MDALAIRRNVTVVEGGLLKSPWVVDTRKVICRDFLPMLKEDFQLAHALGFEGKQPWGDNEFITYLKTLRDTAVDTCIRAAAVASDPMSDHGRAANSKTRGRVGLVTTSVPQIISVTHPAFISADGAEHGPFTFDALSADRRRAVLHVELSESVLDFFVHAAASCKVTKVASIKRASEDLPELLQTCCKWRRMATSPYVYVRYQSADGVWHVRSETPHSMEDPELYAAIVREVENRLRKFFDEHHVATMGGE